MAADTTTMAAPKTIPSATAILAGIAEVGGSPRPSSCRTEPAREAFAGGAVVLVVACIMITAVVLWAGPRSGCLTTHDGLFVRLVHRGEPDVAGTEIATCPVEFTV